MLKCHYSAIAFVVPDHIFQVASDLMEKYCNSEKALPAMFGQHCLPLVEQNTSKTQVTVDIGGQPYLSIRTKCIRDSYPLLCPGFHVNKCPVNDLEGIRGTNSTLDCDHFEKARMSMQSQQFN